MIRVWFPMQVCWTRYTHREPLQWMLRQHGPKSYYSHVNSWSIHIVSTKNSIRIYQKRMFETSCPSEESVLHVQCAKFLEPLGWKLVQREWNVIPGFDEYGKGDLVFRNGKTYLVIECKRRHTPKVYEQARFYAASWKLRHAEPNSDVIYGIWTCHKQEILGILTSKKEARKICERDACKRII